MEPKTALELLWDVFGVYKGWLQAGFQKLQPYRVHFTAANISTFIVTMVAVVLGTMIFFRKRKAKLAWEEARRNSLIAKQDEEWMRARKRARAAKKAKEAAEIKDPYMKKVVGPANCPFKHMFGDLMDMPDEAGDGDLHQHGEDGNGEGREIMDKLREQIHNSIREERRKQGKASDSDEDVLIASNKLSNIREKGAGDAGDEHQTTFARDKRDPLEFAMHIPAELKKIQNKVTTREMEKQLSVDQKEEEARTRRKQLEQIFQLMQDQKDKFGPQTTEDMEEQMRMYSL